VSTEKKSSFLGSPRDVFRRPSAAPEPIAPKFLHTTFPSKYFVLAEFHPPRLSYAADPLFRIVTLWPAIIVYGSHNELANGEDDVLSTGFLAYFLNDA